MTLEEAILHALDVCSKSSCDKCAAEHLQLAMWLMELKILKDKEQQKMNEKLKPCPFCGGEADLLANC